MLFHDYSEENLLDKPLEELRSLYARLNTAVNGGEYSQEALFHAVKRAYIFKYNEIKRILIAKLITELEHKAMFILKEACEKRIAEYEEERKPDIEHAIKFHDEEDIAFVQAQSEKYKKHERLSIKKEAVQFILNKVILEVLEEAKKQIESFEEEIKKMQALLETEITEKQYLGLFTIIPVKKKITQVIPIVNKNSIPDALMEEVVYKRLSTKKAKEWVQAHPGQTLFEVIEKEYYLRIAQNK